MVRCHELRCEHAFDGVLRLDCPHERGGPVRRLDRIAKLVRQAFRHLLHKVGAPGETWESGGLREIDMGLAVLLREYELSVVVYSKSRCPQPSSLSPPLLEAMLPGVIRDGARLLLAL